MTEHDKKISGVQAPANPVQQQSAPSEGRRRLMKGALAAPAVMTLMSGRLMAAASSRCDDKFTDEEEDVSASCAASLGMEPE